MVQLADLTYQHIYHWPDGSWAYVDSYDAETHGPLSVEVGIVVIPGSWGVEDIERHCQNIANS